MKAELCADTAGMPMQVADCPHSVLTPQIPDMFQQVSHCDMQPAVSQTCNSASPFDFVVNDRANA